MASLPPVYIVSAARTPVGSFLGCVFLLPGLPFPLPLLFNLSSSDCFGTTLLTAHLIALLPARAPPSWAPMPSKVRNGDVLRYASLSTISVTQAKAYTLCSCCDTCSPDQGQRCRGGVLRKCSLCQVRFPALPAHFSHPRILTPTTKWPNL